MRDKVLDYTAQLKNQDLNNREITAMELIKLYRFTLKEIDILQDLSEHKTN